MLTNKTVIWLTPPIVSHSTLLFYFVEVNWRKHVFAPTHGNDHDRLIYLRNDPENYRKNIKFRRASINYFKNIDTQAQGYKILK